MEKPSKTKRIIHSLMAFDRVGHSIQVEPVPLTCPGLPKEFHLARVAVVADVHLPDQLIPLPRLVKYLKMQQPDAIFLPGDLTNSYTDFDETGLRQLAKALVKIAPCFAVPGNHEWRLGREPRYREILTRCGVHYLCDSYADWHRGSGSLRLYGMGQQAPAPLAVEGQPTIVLSTAPSTFRCTKRRAGTWWSAVTPTADTSVWDAGRCSPPIRASFPATPTAFMKRVPPGWWSAGG